MYTTKVHGDSVLLLLTMNPIESIHPVSIGWRPDVVGWNEIALDFINRSLKPSCVFFFLFLVPSQYWAPFFCHPFTVYFLLCCFFSSIGCRLRKWWRILRKIIYICFRLTSAKSSSRQQFPYFFPPFYFVSRRLSYLGFFFIRLPPAGCCSIFFFFCSYTLISCQFLLDFIFYLLARWSNWPAPL